MARSKSDKIFQRKKTNFSRKRENFSRTKAASIEPRARILIVCEDSKHAPRYFKAMCLDLGLLPNTDVRICGEECGSAPSSVYDYAILKLEEDFKDLGSDDFDRVYCVFDKDQHTTYQATLKKIKDNPVHSLELKDGRNSQTKKAKIIAIRSVPCFEYWILMHFSNSTASLANGAQVQKAIKAHWKKYQKENSDNLYEGLKDKTSDALKNSRITFKDAASSGATGPLTEIHILVEDLLSQKRR